MTEVAKEKRMLIASALFLLAWTALCMNVPDSDPEHVVYRAHCPSRGD